MKKDKSLRKITDKMRLDWLQHKGNMMRWVARRSITGRGFRLHQMTANEDWPNSALTPREAIDNAMLAEKEGLK